MSQSATFYPVNENEFAVINRNPNNLDLLKGRHNRVTFQGTHEGLRYVLSKALSNHDAELVNEIFYPTTYLGNISQTVFPDSTEAEAYIDVTGDEEYDGFDSEPVSYHDPAKVKRIAVALDCLHPDEILAHFDPEELNRDKIYPWCWNRSQEDDRACNERHILADFESLKELFSSATRTNSYLLCFVG